MKTKSLTFMVKAGPDAGLAEGQFEAYASVFGNKDSYGDVVVKGAFAEDLLAWTDSGFPIPLLFGHNMYDPDFNIGIVEAKEDDHGLLVIGTLDLDSPKAQQVHRLIKGKRINQMSFAYDVLEGAAVKTADLGDVYELRKLHIHEVSVVPLGANSETEILAVKAAADALTSGAKSGRAISAKNEGELRKAYDSIGVVLSALESTDQEKASGQDAAKDEEPQRAKSEELVVNPSVQTLIAEVQLLAFGQEGAQ
ncbi:HK97 family phage prohead protease [Cryobacterium zongtaii]|uniref:HK97 family phage prohead protease n=1 Tax=Cryobacterium zongtaii TaxID=1259217 RepID=A0A2S3ZCJ4_9MICO|nr:HK97 family phage prohead protease [Cryobacterium zongtaii]POH63951.1 HK97 family phage prohead protease [Cryobacterium zongtaii]